MTKPQQQILECLRQLAQDGATSPPKAEPMPHEWIALDLAHMLHPHISPLKKPKHYSTIELSSPKTVYNLCKELMLSGYLAQKELARYLCAQPDAAAVVIHCFSSQMNARSNADIDHLYNLTRLLFEMLESHYGARFNMVQCEEIMSLQDAESVAITSTLNALATCTLAALQFWSDRLQKSYGAIVNQYMHSVASIIKWLTMDEQVPFPDADTKRIMTQQLRNWTWSIVHIDYFNSSYYISNIQYGLDIIYIYIKLLAGQFNANNSVEAGEAMIAFMDLFIALVDKLVEWRDRRRFEDTFKTLLKFVVKHRSSAFDTWATLLDKSLYNTVLDVKVTAMKMVEYILSVLQLVETCLMLENQAVVEIIVNDPRFLSGLSLLYRTLSFDNGNFAPAWIQTDTIKNELIKEFKKVKRVQKLIAPPPQPTYYPPPQYHLTYQREQPYGAYSPATPPRYTEHTKPWTRTTTAALSNAYYDDQRSVINQQAPVPESWEDINISGSQQATTSSPYSLIDLDSNEAPTTTTPAPATTVMTAYQTTTESGYEQDRVATQPKDNEQKDTVVEIWGSGESNYQYSTEVLDDQRHRRRQGKSEGRSGGVWSQFKRGWNLLTRLFVD